MEFGQRTRHAYTYSLINIKFRANTVPGAIWRRVTKTDGSTNRSYGRVYDFDSRLWFPKLANIDESATVYIFVVYIGSTRAK